MPKSINTKPTVIVTEDPYCLEHVTVCRTIQGDLEADLAFRLLERFATISGEPDGEDSAGRQRLKLQAPKSIVTRAFDIAEEYVKEGFRRDHFIDLPIPAVKERYKKRAMTK